MDVYRMSAWPPTIPMEQLAAKSQSTDILQRNTRYRADHGADAQYFQEAEQEYGVCGTESMRARCYMLYGDKDGELMDHAVTIPSLLS